jgi:hypothetical protein
MTMFPDCAWQDAGYEHKKEVKDGDDPDALDDEDEDAAIRRHVSRSNRWLHVSLACSMCVCLGAGHVWGLFRDVPRMLIYMPACGCANFACRKRKEEEMTPKELKMRTIKDQDVLIAFLTITRNNTTRQIRVVNAHDTEVDPLLAYLHDTFMFGADDSLYVTVLCMSVWWKQPVCSVSQKLAENSSPSFCTISLHQPLLHVLQLTRFRAVPGRVRDRHERQQELLPGPPGACKSRGQEAPGRRTRASMRSCLLFVCVSRW